MRELRPSEFNFIAGGFTESDIYSFAKVGAQISIPIGIIGGGYLGAGTIVTPFPMQVFAIAVGAYCGLYAGVIVGYLGFAFLGTLYHTTADVLTEIYN